MKAKQMPKGQNPKFYQPGDRIPTRVVDYKQIITEQVQVCTQILNFAFSTADILNAENTVNVLESLVIRQTKDEDYQTKLKQLIENHERRWKEMNKKERRLLFKHMKRQYIVSKFRLLMILISKVGLSYVAEVSVLIDGKPDAPLFAKDEDATI